MAIKRIAFTCILTACALFGIGLLVYEWDARRLPPLVASEPKMSIEKPLYMIETKTPAVQTDAEINFIPSEEEKVSSHISKAIGPNTIIIRGKAFPYKDNIDKKTLEKNIGWMNSSARPGELGICIFMGHRNGQLRVLKDVAYGNVITIVDEYSQRHNYMVVSGEVVETNTITYTATNVKKLILLTCYPFYYSGQAPHQYVVTAIGE